MTKKPQRPHVICHMVPSVDGRIVVEHWQLSPKVTAEYERIGNGFGADAWMIGRISMAPYAGKARIPTRKTGARIPRTTFIARPDAESYAIALDPSGKLTWKSNSIEAEHVIAVLGEGVSDEYLAFLQDKGVSYLFGGKRDMNLERVLHTLRREFGIEKLLLEGGGKINGAFLRANLIDELSLLVAPIADGGVAVPSLFDGSGGKSATRKLGLISVEQVAADLVWLRYRVKR